MINILDPDVIVIGGVGWAMCKPLSPGADRCPFLFQSPFRHPLIAPALGDSAGVFGARAAGPRRLRKHCSREPPLPSSSVAGLGIHSFHDQDCHQRVRPHRPITAGLYERPRQDHQDKVAISGLAAPRPWCTLSPRFPTRPVSRYPVQLADSNMQVGGDHRPVCREGSVQAALAGAGSGCGAGLHRGVRLPGRCRSHLGAGAGGCSFPIRRTRLDATIVYGSSHQVLTGRERIVSGTSCTTCCVVPVIEHCIEIQRINWYYYDNSFGHARSASHRCLSRRLTQNPGSQSIIPVDTKLAGVGTYPSPLDRKFRGDRGTGTDHQCNHHGSEHLLFVKVTVSDVNQALQRASRGTLHGILDYTEEPLVSVDFNHDAHSCIIDGTQTRVSDANLVKMLMWCDNEWGFANPCWIPPRP